MFARLPEWGKRLALSLIGIAVGVLVVELAVRIFYPTAIMAVEAQAPDTNNPPNQYFDADDVLGFRPILGTQLYDDNGIIVTRSYISKSPNAHKILFIGDSVTMGGRIIEGLADLIGSENASLLNAGVASYNIPQEIDYFFGYLKKNNPDVVVHQLHINDLGTFSGVVRFNEGTVKIYSPRLKSTTINPTLYRYSQLYRFLVAMLQATFSKDELKIATYQSLRRMRDYARANGIAYHVILFPLVQPPANWSRADRETREYLLRISDELHLGIVDLLPVAERLIAEGIDAQHAPGDTWHPSAKMGVESAKYIIEKIPTLGHFAAQLKPTSKP